MVCGSSSRRSSVISAWVQSRVSATPGSLGSGIGEAPPEAERGTGPSRIRITPRDEPLTSGEAV
jgi:hypothetical protein